MQLSQTVEDMGRELDEVKARMRADLESRDGLYNNYIFALCSVCPSLKFKYQVRASYIKLGLSLNDLIMQTEAPTCAG